MNRLEEVAGALLEARQPRGGEDDLTAQPAPRGRVFENPLLGFTVLGDLLPPAKVAGDVVDGIDLCANLIVTRDSRHQKRRRHRSIHE